MHREIQFLDRPFQTKSRLGLHLFTFIVGGLLALEAWPVLTSWFATWTGWTLPALPAGVTWGGRQWSWALLAAFLGGARALYTSAESLLAGRFGADLALAVALVAALLINQPLVAAEVAFIGLVGECLEAYTFGRTQAAVRRLVETCPRMCLVLRDGAEIKVPVDQVNVGEHVVVLPGKRVPVDGIIRSGRSAVDQSYLTGEAIPVDKEVGDPVWAGTFNQHGRLVVEVQRVASQTVMGRVIEITAQAMQKKSRVMRLADQWARWFLPLVAGLAAVTFLLHWLWFGRHRTDGALIQAVYPTLAVLVVACPCALILASPATLMAAVARLARTGVLLRHGRALENLAHVDALAFDKTGTLTEGKPRFASLSLLESRWTAEEILRLAAAAEAGSEHPLGQVVVSAAREQGATLPAADEFQAHPSGGVSAKVDRHRVLVGNRRLLSEMHVPWHPEADEVLRRLDAEGQTPLLIAVDDQLVAVLGVWDVVRLEAPAVLEELRRCGLNEQVLLTGDRRAPAEAVAQRVGISTVQYELTPVGKADFIKSWQTSGRRVAMIGDGVNDAPALAQADVGLALGGTGADIAAEAGDIVLMGDPLKPLPLLIRLARQMDAILRQNLLVFAVGVNVLGVILTAWILPFWSEEARQQAPFWAAVYHQVGSLGVLLNAMRLLWFERQEDWKWLAAASNWTRQIDAALERFNLHEFSHWLADHYRLATSVAGSLLLGGWLLSGFTAIPAGAVGIVQRFGRTLPENLEPGLHWRWPWPVERVRHVELDLLRPVALGFRWLGQNEPAPATWPSLHPGVAAREREEALMITGDGNLIEVQVVLWYRVSDARLYLFETAACEAILQSLAESVVREVLAGQSFLKVLADGRGEFEHEVRRRLQERLTEPAFTRLGIDLHAVAFQDLHPPREVVEAYYQVTRALSRRTQLVTAAQIEQDNRRAQELMARERVLAQAHGRADEQSRRVRAEVAAFSQFVAAHRLAGALSTAAAPQPLAALDLALTEFRLTVELCEQILPGRPKVLRDTNLPGHIHLVPELLRLRLPPLPRDRATPGGAVAPEDR